MHARKVGLEVAPGRFHAGEVVVADIGLERGETENALVTPEILERVPRRRPDQNKYTAGSVLIVGGSRGLTGAPSLAAEAAIRADAGYVAVAVPDSTLQVFETRLLEAVKLGCPEDDGKISPRAVDPIANHLVGVAGLNGSRWSRGCSPSSTCRSWSTPTDSSASSRSSGAARRC